MYSILLPCSCGVLWCAMLTQVAEEVFRIAGRDPMIEVAIALQVWMLGILLACCQLQALVMRLPTAPRI